MQQIDRCRICGGSALETVLDLGNQSLTGRFPAPNEPDPLSGPLELALCRDGAGGCGLLQLRHRFPLSEMYGPSYGYRSSNNTTMVKHLERKIANLIDLARPGSGERVLDIGANDGTTLGFYRGRGLDLVGIDPSAAKFAGSYPAGSRLIVDFFSAGRVVEAAGSRKFKIITSIAMFYDLEDPLSFMREVASLLDADGVWEFEQHYMPTMLDRCAYDSVCHEHISYYGLRQIKWMTDRSDLKIIGLSTNDINGGSFSVIVSRRQAKYPEAVEEIEAMLAAEAGLNELAPYRDFARRVSEHRDHLRAYLSEQSEQGKLVCGYGASTKGNVILQYCGITRELLPAIAEKYPLKFGLETPGTRIPILSEAEVRARKPDSLLVLPWYFRDEILVRERAYCEAGGTLVFVLPAFEEVTGS